MTPPLTPMEQGGTWATSAEEDDFVSVLLAETAAVSVTFGVGSDGSPLRALVVGGDIGDARTLIIASQHGFESAPREAALRVARAFAYAPPAVPVVMVPTANPWGTRVASRYNSVGQDINRHHCSLSAPEARAVRSLWNRTRGAVLYDGHETADASEGAPVTADVSVLSHGRIAAPAMRSWAQALAGTIAAAVAPASVAPYPLASHEGTVTATWGAQGQPSVLVESRISTGSDDARVGWHVTAMNAVIEDAQTADLAAVSSESARWARGEGFAAHAPVFLYENGFRTAPVGYRIARTAVPGPVFEAHRIASVDVSSWGTDQYVPMDQPAYALIPWLLDPRAPRPIATAVPVYPGAEPVVDFGVDRLHEPHRLSVAGTAARRMVTDAGMVWGT